MFLRAHLDLLGEVALVIAVLAHQHVDDKREQYDGDRRADAEADAGEQQAELVDDQGDGCLLYTSRCV